MKELEITPELEEQYRKAPNTCPYCGSNELNADHIEAMDWTAYRNVICEDCKAQWTETFEIIGITNAFREED